MAKKGSSGHSGILSSLLKTALWLAILGTALVIIYNMMPGPQKKMVNKLTGQRFSQVDRQVKVPATFEQATQELHNDKVVPISNVQVDVNGNVSGSLNGQNIHTQLAGVGMIDQSSAFYRANASKVQASLQQVVSPNAHPKYTVKETKDKKLYLFINNQMFQQTWLERGLAYVNVPQGYDSQSTTLYTAQNNAQSNDANIWQVNGALQRDKNGYRLDPTAERDYLDNKTVKFTEQGQSTNFWGKVTKFLR